MLRRFDIAHRAQAATREAAKPGVQCQGVDAATRKVSDGAGLDPDYKTSFTGLVMVQAWMRTSGLISSGEIHAARCGNRRRIDDLHGGFALAIAHLRCDVAGHAV